MDSISLKKMLNSESLLSGKKVTEINPVGGGCIHNAWQIKVETGEKLFAKTSSKEKFALLEFERKGLNILSNKINPDLLIVPKPLISKQFQNTGILIMPWINLDSGNESKLGEGLALLHKESSQEKQNLFGWASEGFIGTSPQVGGWSKSWGECFVNLRIVPQLRMSQKWGLIFDSKEFQSKLIKYLDNHNPRPSLVHGDLWSGNAATHANQKGIIFDPAIWWADREVDIAMTKLFGGFSNNFYNSYQKTLHRICLIYRLHQSHHCNQYPRYYSSMKNR